MIMGNRARYGNQYQNVAFKRNEWNNYIIFEKFWVPQTVKPYDDEVKAGFNPRRDKDGSFGNLNFSSGEFSVV